MSGLLKGDLDVAQAMIYNEYAQVLEAKNPATGKLYKPDDLNVVDFNDPAVGTAMLQDQIFATDKWLKTGDNARHRDEVPAGDVQGLDLLPRQRPEVRRHRPRQGLAARRQPPGVADERDQRARSGRRRPASACSTRRCTTRRSTIATTYKVLKAAPSADATRTDLAQKALDALGTSVDTKGASFAKETVTLKEGGN